MTNPFYPMMTGICKEPKFVIFGSCEPFSQRYGAPSRKFESRDCYVFVFLSKAFNVVFSPLGAWKINISV